MLPKKIFYLLCVLIFSLKVQANEFNLPEPKKKRPPVTFTHQPFLLLKFNPVAYFMGPSSLMVGAEIAPPIGKFSINGEYGIGKGAFSPYKYVRKNYNDASIKQWNVEIRTYFSDWYPFYALDAKPFGRYYALEFQNLDVTRTENMLSFSEGNYNLLENSLLQTNRKAVHLKFGKHFIRSKHFFIDAYVGGGLGWQKTFLASGTSTNTLKEMPLYSFPIEQNFTLERGTQFIDNFNYAPKNGEIIELDHTQFRFSYTVGVRLCLVL